MTGFMEISQEEMYAIDGGGTKASSAVTSALCAAAALYCVKSIPIVTAVPFGPVILVGAAIGFSIASLYYANIACK